MSGHWEGTNEVEGHVAKERWVPDKGKVQYCEATVVVDGQKQACDQVLDEHGNCDYARDHEED